MNNYFTGCKCIEEVKSIYHKMAIMLHPDKPTGNTQAMQDLNNQYDSAFMMLKDTHKSIKEGSEPYYTASTPTNEAPSEFRDIISTLINLKGIDVELCGRWLWITGDTKSHKDILKSFGCKWCNTKQAWSWHFAEDSCRGRGRKNLDTIRNLYGSQKFSTNGQLLLD